MEEQKRKEVLRLQNLERKKRSSRCLLLLTGASPLGKYNKQSGSPSIKTSSHQVSPTQAALSPTKGQSLKSKLNRLSPTKSWQSFKISKDNNHALMQRLTLNLQESADKRAQSPNRKHSEQTVLGNIFIEQMKQEAKLAHHQEVSRNGGDAFFRIKPSLQRKTQSPKNK